MTRRAAGASPAGGTAVRAAALVARPVDGAGAPT
jgi:hypothetical protein